MSEIEVIKSLTFYGFAISIILFALLTIVSNRILYAIIFSAILFFATGGIFFDLGADYNAVAQIITYGVAVPVLLIFALIFTSNEEDKKVNLSFSPRFFIAFISTTFLFMLLLYSIKFSLYVSDSLNWIFNKSVEQSNSIESFNSIAKGIYETYGFAFELFAFLLLIVIVGITTLNIIKEKKRG